MEQEGGGGGVAMYAPIYISMTELVLRYANIPPGIIIKDKSNNKSLKQTVTALLQPSLHEYFMAGEHWVPIIDKVCQRGAECSAVLFQFKSS